MHDIHWNISKVSYRQAAHVSFWNISTLAKNRHIFQFCDTGNSSNMCKALKIQTLKNLNKFKNQVSGCNFFFNEILNKKFYLKPKAIVKIYFKVYSSLSSLADCNRIRIIFRKASSYPLEEQGCIYPQWSLLLFALWKINSCIMPFWTVNRFYLHCFERRQKTSHYNCLIAVSVLRVICNTNFYR